MALVKKPVSSHSSSGAFEAGLGRTSASAARDAELQRKRARTLAKQQQASITRQLQNSDLGRSRAETAQTLVAGTSAAVAATITNVGISAQRQAASTRP